MVVVEHQYPLRCGTRLLQRVITGQQVVRRQDAGLVLDPYRAGVPPPDAVRPPPRAGRDQDVGEPVVKGVIRRDLTLQADVHVAVVPAELPDPVVGDAAPRGQAGQTGLTRNPSAKLPGGLGEHHGVAPLTKRTGRFQAGRAGPDDQDAGV